MDLRYPIGPWKKPDHINYTQVLEWIEDIRLLPKQLNELCVHLDNKELQKTYREDGWNIGQLIHHIADSHINSYVRHKLAYTLRNPSITPYPEEKWAILNDVRLEDVKVSLDLIAALHHRWVNFLKSLEDEDLECGFFHLGDRRVISLRESIGMYSWHGRHHMEHIKIALRN